MQGLGRGDPLGVGRAMGWGEGLPSWGAAAAGVGMGMGRGVGGMGLVGEGE